MFLKVCLLVLVFNSFVYGFLVGLYLLKKMLIEHAKVYHHEDIYYYHKGTYNASLILIGLLNLTLTILMVWAV